MIQNYMAVLVAQTLDRELKANPQKYSGLCLCPSCLVFMQAYALNQVPPFYVTCVAGEVFGEYRHKELQYQSDILVAVTKGIEAARRLDLHAERP